MSRGLAVHSHISYFSHVILRPQASFPERSIGWNRNDNTDVIGHTHLSERKSPSAAVPCLALEFCKLPVDSLDTKPSVGRIVYKKENLVLDIFASCFEFLLFMARNTDFFVFVCLFVKLI